MEAQPTHRFAADGDLRLSVHRVTADDFDRLSDLMSGLSSSGRSAWQRFMHDAPAEPALAATFDLAAGTVSARDAWLVLADPGDSPGSVVAAGGYQAIGDGKAAMVVVVRDDMQRRGIGSRLLNFLLEQARSAGIRTAIASFDANNEAVWQLLHYSPFHVTWRPAGREVEVIIYLQPRPIPDVSLN